MVNNSTNPFYNSPLFPQPHSVTLCLIALLTSKSLPCSDLESVNICSCLKYPVSPARL